MTATRKGGASDHLSAPRGWAHRLVGAQCGVLCVGLERVQPTTSPQASYHHCEIRACLHRCSACAAHLPSVCTAASPSTGAARTARITDIGYRLAPSTSAVATRARAQTSLGALPHGRPPAHASFRIPRLIEFRPDLLLVFASKPDYLRLRTPSGCVGDIPDHSSSKRSYHVSPCLCLNSTAGPALVVGRSGQCLRRQRK